MTFFVDYEWRLDSPVPLLIITAQGDLLAEADTAARMIDEAHAYARQSEYEGVYLIYDLTQTSGKLSLVALMHRTLPSPNVRGVVIVGVQSRVDEMAVLIQGVAKRIPYEYRFYKTQTDALNQFISSAARR